MVAAVAIGFFPFISVCVVDMMILPFALLAFLSLVMCQFLGKSWISTCSCCLVGHWYYCLLATRHLAAFNSDPQMLYEGTRPMTDKKLCHWPLRGSISPSVQRRVPSKAPHPLRTVMLCGQDILREQQKARAWIYICLNSLRRFRHAMPLLLPQFTWREKGEHLD